MTDLRRLLARPCRGPYAVAVTALRSLTALLLALFVGGVGMQDTVLLCRSLSTTHRSCCCAHPLRLPALGDELARAPCCDAAALEATAIPPSAGATASYLVTSPVMLEDGPALPRPAALARALPPATRAVATLATGPPLHLRYHALLI